MEFCVVASNYRTETQQVHVFLDNVVTQLVDRGITCNVIAPQSWFRYFFKKDSRRELVSQRKTANGNPYTVYSPLFTVFPQRKLGKLCLSDLSKLSYTRALKKIYKKYEMHADIVYSHFIQAGIPAVRLAKYLGLPSFIANGEADTLGENRFNSKKMVMQTLEDVTGIICVSTKNKDEIYELSGGNESIMKKVRIIPNAVDETRFFPRDKIECRRKLGWPEDAFILAFTGSFIERKGVLRVANAADRVGGVHTAFVGVGPQTPTCNNILHCGRVNNADLPNLLCAADAFILPTLAEGCSNAIVEALACGLPIISSNLPFNWDVLDESCAILLDPMNDNEIENAIRTLRDDKELCHKLHEGSVKMSAELTLPKRVDKILTFISEMTSEDLSR